jgi:hypothetical protein
MLNQAIAPFGGATKDAEVQFKAPTPNLSTGPHGMAISALRQLLLRTVPSLAVTQHNPSLSAVKDRAEASAG